MLKKLVYLKNVIAFPDKNRKFLLIEEGLLIYNTDVEKNL